MPKEDLSNPIIKLTDDIYIHRDFASSKSHELIINVSVEKLPKQSRSLSETYEILESEKIRVRQHYIRETFQNEDILKMVGELPSQQQIQLYELTSGPIESFKSRVKKTYEDFKTRQMRVDDLSEQVILELQKRPDKIKLLSPYKFEVFVASLLKDQGWNIEMTPKTRDHGRDIIATMSVSGFNILTIVECKKWREDRPVGIDVLERFIFTVRERDRANFGLIATSSYFSRDSKNLSSEYDWLIKLKDFDGLKEILKDYGELKQDESSGLWIPKLKEK